MTYYKEKEWSIISNNKSIILCEFGRWVLSQTRDREYTETELQQKLKQLVKSAKAKRGIYET